MILYFISLSDNQGYSILKKLDRNNTTNCIVHYKLINMYVLLFRPYEN